MYKTLTNSRIMWIVLLFLFFAIVLFYIDRSALGIMAPFLQKEIGWSEQQYGNINTAFMIGYGLCYLGTDGYNIPFLIASVGYLIALVISHLLIPEIKPLNL
jgi:ACS family hexuronate transporter-like MFS transporter